MTRADELWLATTFWLVRIVHWSSSSHCVSHSAALCHNLSSQDTDVFSTTWWGQKGIWQTQLGTNSDLGLSIDTDTCIVHKQTNKDCASFATINSARSATSGVQCKQGEKQQRRCDASATRKNNLVNVGTQTDLITLLDLCVSSQHSPNTVTRLSHNSIGHGVFGVNMVVIRCSSQHSASNGCREMRRFVHNAVNIILQRFVLSIVEHGQSLNCCQLLIPSILTDTRVLLKLWSFFVRKCVTHHSCQLVEYCS